MEDSVGSGFNRRLWNGRGFLLAVTSTGNRSHGRRSIVTLADVGARSPRLADRFNRPVHLSPGPIPVRLSPGVRGGMPVPQDERHAVCTEEDEESAELPCRVYPTGEESELSEREGDGQPKRDRSDAVADAVEELPGQTRQGIVRVHWRPYPPSGIRSPVPTVVLGAAAPRKVRMPRPGNRTIL